jgi:hypothetical protein
LSISFLRLPNLGMPAARLRSAARSGASVAPLVLGSAQAWVRAMTDHLSPTTVRVVFQHFRMV